MRYDAKAISQIVDPSFAGIESRAVAEVQAALAEDIINSMGRRKKKQKKKKKPPRKGKY